LRRPGEILGPDKLLVVLVRMGIGSGDAAALAREHLDAGSDHVPLTLPPGTDFADGVEQFLQIAPTVFGLAG
jgi:hypothetical protein